MPSLAGWLAGWKENVPQLGTQNHKFQSMLHKTAVAGCSRAMQCDVDSLLFC